MTVESMITQVLTIIHLLPYDGIGGVESAARTMANFQTSHLEFTLKYIYRLTGSQFQRLTTFSPIPLFTAAYRVITEKPDLLIVSLWRACIVGILVKCFSPQTKIALMLHYPKDVHWPDKVLTRLQAQYACQIWADSQETLLKRLPGSTTQKGHIISFVANCLTALETKPVKPAFIFWGRLHLQKNMEHAIRIFARIHAARTDARFIVIGPDAGKLEDLQQQVNELGLSGVIRFTGPMNLPEIRQQAQFASFYLQTSVLEGMAMSVVEAMQLGLVPVVTPVGEIGHYCHDGENALFIGSDDHAVARILDLLDDNNGYQLLRRNALATWHQKPLYAESLLQACEKLLLTHQP